MTYCTILEYNIYSSFPRKEKRIQKKILLGLV